VEEINKINQVIQAYFEKNPSISEIPVKDLMPEFIRAGVFVKDEKKGLPIRKVLRDLDANDQLNQIPFVYADRKDKNVYWYFRRDLSTNFSKPNESTTDFENSNPALISSGRDKNYVLNLCDQVLKQKGSRLHQFDFLVDDIQTKFTVDTYYSELNLVIDYHEFYKPKVVKRFEKDEIPAPGGIAREEERNLYDQRRTAALPANGITVVEINYTDFSLNEKNLIERDLEEDLRVVSQLLKSVKGK
jgi:hypothetical protein